MKAKEYIIDIININIKRFEEMNYGECWGKIEEDYFRGKKVHKCYFNAQIVYRELQKGGFEFNTVKKEWAESNFVQQNSQGRFVHQTTKNKEKGNYIIFILD